MIARAALLLLLASEALALYTVGEVVMRVFPEPGNELVSAPVFVLVALVAFFAPAALDWFAVEGGKRATVITVLAFLVLYGALRLQYGHDLALWDFGWARDFVLETGKLRDWIAPVITSGFLLLLTWSWAAWRSRSELWLDNAPRALVVPFVVVTIALVVTAGSEQADVVTRGGVVFYGVALAALACSQLSQSGSSIGGFRAGGITTVMLAGTAAFAVLGVLLVGVLLDPLVDILSVPVIAVGKAVAWFVTYAIFVPIAWVLTNLFELIFSLLGVGESEPQEIEMPEPAIPVDGAEPLGEGDSVAARVTRYTLAGGMIFLGVAVVAAIIFVLAILRRRAAEAEPEGPESERAGSLGDDLREAARGLLRRDRRPEPSGEGVVRLYLDVLESARREGTPRGDAQTPHEFAPVLISAFHRDVTDEITAAFEYARYAGRPPDEATLADLRRRWENRD